MPKHHTSFILMLGIGCSARCRRRADTFTGKIDLIEAKSDGTRFFVRDRA